MVYNLARAIERNAHRRPDDVALICVDSQLSHRVLRNRVHALTAGLRSLEIGPTDVVAMLLPNCTEFVVTTFAVNAAGAIFLPLNLRLAVDEWTYILGHSQARAVVVHPTYAATVPAIRSACPDLRTVIGLGEMEATDANWYQLLAQHLGADEVFHSVDADDISRLMYTSGTTARPKGVPLTYGNVTWKTFDHVVEFGLTAQDRTLVAGPLYHVGAYDLPGTGTLYVGGSLVILPSFDATASMQAIQDHDVTNVWLAPAMLNAVLQLEELDSFDATTIRFITNGGEKMPLALIERFRKAFPGAWLADSFGMTESASGDTVLDRDHMVTKLGSVGRPLLHLDVRVVDDTGGDVAPGEPGELLLKGPKVFRGYFRDAAATEMAFVDGWFRTGDIAHQDLDGYLFIDDRKKDMIVSGGENIASPEIERVLYEHPAVLEAAVVGMPDRRWGEVPRAVVAVKPDHEVTADELTALCAAHLAKFKVPKRIDFVDALPRTSTGKVLKRDLRADTPTTS